MSASRASAPTRRGWAGQLAWVGVAMAAGFVGARLGTAQVELPPALSRAAEAALPPLAAAAEAWWPEGMMLLAPLLGTAALRSRG